MSTGLASYPCQALHLRLEFQQRVVSRAGGKCLLDHTSQQKFIVVLRALAKPGFRERIDQYVEAERQIEGEMARRRIRA